jgi:hypothetical protein
MRGWVMNYKESTIHKVEKNFMTTTVGAINAFEEEFRDLMENDEFKSRFQQVRKRILDIGNDQKRRSNRVLNKSTIERPRYTYVFEHTGEDISHYFGAKNEGY